MTARRVGVAALGTTLTASPPLLVGGLGLFMQPELIFGDAALGTLVGAFFAAAALVSIPAARITRTMGAGGAIGLGAAITTACLLTIALAANTSDQLLALLLACGAASAIAQVGANSLIAGQVPVGEQGIAFGVKQAAIPFGAVFAGLAVPLSGIVGWRASLGVVALIGSTALVLAMRPWQFRAPGGPQPPLAHPAAGKDAAEPLARPFYLLAAGGAIASAAGNAPVVFLVSSLVTMGVQADAAGALLAAGSAAGLLVRIAGGWFADRTSHGALRLVAVLLCGGAAGNMMLAAWGTVPVVIAVLLLFGGGWGWPGLLWLGIARETRAPRALPLGIAQAGTFGGAVAGPVFFGIVAEAESVQAAWSMTAGAAVLAAFCIALGETLIRRHTGTRDPEYA